jgi:hypothetical protein
MNIDKAKQALKTAAEITEKKTARFRGRVPRARKRKGVLPQN